MNKGILKHSCPHHMCAIHVAMIGPKVVNRVGLSRETESTPPGPLQKNLNVSNMYIKVIARTESLKCNYKWGGRGVTWEDGDGVYGGGRNLGNTVEPNKQTWLGFSFHPYIIYVALDKFPKPISAQPPHP